MNKEEIVSDAQDSAQVLMREIIDGLQESPIDEQIFHLLLDEAAAKWDLLPESTRSVFITTLGIFIARFSMGK